MTVTTNKRGRRRLYNMPEPDTDAKQHSQNEDCEVLEAEVMPPDANGPDTKLRDDETRLQNKAMDIVTLYAGYSSMAGLLPIPVIDNLAVSSVHLRMVHELARCYGLQFPARRSMLAIASLIWGAGLPSLTRWTGTKLLAGIPLIGGAASWAGGIAMNGAITYAIGKVLVYHFATGGNLFNFDAAKARVFFLESYKQAQANPAW